jgi:hypothetical protein
MFFESDKTKNYGTFIKNEKEGYVISLSNVTALQSNLLGWMSVLQETAKQKRAAINSSFLSYPQLLIWWISWRRIIKTLRIWGVRQFRLRSAYLLLGVKSTCVFQF